MLAGLKCNPFLFILSFLLVAFAQPDWSSFCCVLASAVGYGLFWKSIDRSNKKFYWALVWFGAVQVIHLNWFFSDRYVGPYIFLFIGIIVVALGIQFGLITLMIGNFRALSAFRMLAVAGLAALFEWVRLFVLSGFSWNPIGLALSGTLYGMQLASLFGVFGLTYWIMLTNLLALKFLVVPNFKHAGFWIVFAGVPYLFGAAQVHFHHDQMAQLKPKELKTLLVQTALYPEEKISLNGSQSLPATVQWQRILSLLVPYQDKPVDLIVLSEAVVPHGTDTPVYYKETIAQAFINAFGNADFLPEPKNDAVGNSYWAQGLANAFHADVIIGLEDIDKGLTQEEIKAYNAGFLFRPFAEERERYEKRVLVPIGEYIPFNWCRKILSKYGIEGSFSRGQEAKVFRGKHTAVGMSICYEETYGHLMRENRVKGAALLVNLSNDVWYPHSRLPIVHFLHGRLRSVEAGIPILRCCNTGVTCGIDSLGRLLGCLEYENLSKKSPQDTLYLSVPMYHFPTLYTFFGDYTVICSSFFFLFVFAASKTKRFSLRDLNFSLLQKNKA